MTKHRPETFMNKSVHSLFLQTYVSSVSWFREVPHVFIYCCSALSGFGSGKTYSKEFTIKPEERLTNFLLLSRITKMFAITP